MQPRRDLRQRQQLCRIGHGTGFEGADSHDILGGDPVFRGTRIPVHAIASQLADGEPDADLRKSYPRLTA